MKNYKANILISVLGISGAIATQISYIQIGKCHPTIPCNLETSPNSAACGLDYADPGCIDDSYFIYGLILVFFFFILGIGLTTGINKYLKRSGRLQS